MNKHLRIVHKNVALRAALNASNQASAATLVTNLQNSKKSKPFRATGNWVAISGDFAAPEVAACLAFAFTNLSPTATARLRLYSDASETVVMHDTGWVPFSPFPAIELEGWTPAQAASAYSYGGGSYARLWFPKTTFKRLWLEISDGDNLQGYIEACCMILGDYISANYNASSTGVTFVDETTQTRSGAYELVSEVGGVARRVPIDLSLLDDEDRPRITDLLRNSRARPILLSVFPESSNPALERDHMVYGKRTKDSDITLQFAGAYKTMIEVEEV